MNVAKGYPCACCGYLTMDGSESGSFDICAVCYWEDNNVQFANVNYRGGANDENVSEARDNYKKFGVYSLQFLKMVRPPHLEEIP